MAELRNTFSWSFSAAEDFDECRRRRYWSKYAMWNGWRRDATDLQRKAYQLNKMTSGPALRGEAVERTVCWILARTREGETVAPEDAYQRVARPFLNRCWQESTQGLWKENPKAYCCLREHYYRQLAPGASAPWARAIADGARACISGFIQSALPRLREIRPAQEIAVATADSGADPESFLFEGLKVYAIPDYACRQGEDLHVHDWKSGVARPRHREQMGVYGLWAHLKQGVAPGAVVLHLEYLAEAREESWRVTDRELDDTKARIRGSCLDMAEYLVDGDLRQNRPVPQAEWDLAVTREPCRVCNFLELCAPELPPAADAG